MSRAHPDLQALAQQSASAMLANDRVVPLLGLRLLQIAPGAATVSMSVRAEMCNGYGICHGGLIFTLADSAFAYACNSGGGTTLAVTASIDFLAPAHAGDELTAVATSVWSRGRSGIYEAVVSNQQGERIALFRGRSQRLRETRVPGGGEA